MSVRIIIDSTADLTPDIKSQMTVVPLMVRFGDEEFIDGVTINHKQFYEKLVLLGYSGLSDILLNKFIVDSEVLWKDSADELCITPIGSVTGTHAGPGAIAVAFFKK